MGGKRSNDWEILTNQAFDAVTQNFFKLNPIVKASLPRAIFEEATYFKEKIGLAFASGGPPGNKWKKLSPATVRKKKSSKILIDTNLLRTITVTKSPYDVGDGEYFVGVPFGPVDKRGTPVIVWASVHENGASDDMGSASSTGKTIKGSAFNPDGVYIPRRSFLQWTWDAYYPDDHTIAERVSNRIRDDVVKKLAFLAPYTTKPGKPTLIKNL